MKGPILSKEIKALWELGFAIHLLKAKSKMPIENGWTKGPRKTWKELERQFRPGMNLGVRLGSASKLSNGYLAVIDCDVKSADPAHEEEMRFKLAEILPGEGELPPQVRSGRGQGSLHLYLATPRPARPKRLSQSNVSVRVKMPSAVRASKHELRTLSALEIAAGWRLRPAWEISLMGEGQQVVLPPSIHPDTGGRYAWDSGSAPEGELPLLPQFGELVDPGTLAEKSKLSNDWKPEAVDLVGSSLPDRVVDQILSGDHVEDRSAALFGVSAAMLRSGFTERQILSVLTDRSTFLGECAYEHSGSDSRRRAAEWVKRYTLDKVKKEVLASEVFRDVAIETPIELDQETANAQRIELVGESTWRDELEYVGKDGARHVKNTQRNLTLILKNALPGPLFTHNVFSFKDFFGVNTPWGFKKGEEITEALTGEITLWCAQNFGLYEPSRDRVEAVVNYLAHRNKVHPVKQYLEGLPEWDGTERLSRLFSHYMGAVGPEPYLSETAVKFVCAMIARIYRPGCAVDFIPIFEGRQGIGKSSAGAILASREWFCDTLPDLKDKDAMLNLQGAWLVEMAELIHAKKAENEHTKAFITRKTDRVRAPYGKRWVDIPRQSVFLGTTNDSDYLKDRSGNRRYWPIEVRQCLFDELREDRDQIFAEALTIWSFEALELTGDEEKKQALELQESRLAESEEGAMKDAIKLDLQKPNSLFKYSRFSALDLFDGGAGGPLERWKGSNWETQNATRALRELGFRKIKIKGRRLWTRDPANQKSPKKA